MTSLQQIHSIYDHVCVEYGIEPDENGIDAITRLKMQRTKTGRAMKPLREMSEAELKFLRFDCVFISAERSPENGGTEESNKANTELLRKDLLKLKDAGLLDFYDSEGDYLEEGSNTIHHESGFFCADVGPHVATTFFSELYRLSEKYNQDSFLYKSAGGPLTRTGYFISTNDAARKAHNNKHDGEFWRAGELYIDLPPEGYWSESESAFGGKRIFFRCEKPS